jgi:hypothetical protein
MTLRTLGLASQSVRLDKVVDCGTTVQVTLKKVAIAE